MSEDYAFWSRRLSVKTYGPPILATAEYADVRRWPTASSAFLFVWNALDIIGKTQLGAKWCTTTMKALAPLASPEAIRLRASSSVDGYPQSDDFWNMEQTRWEKNSEAAKNLNCVISWLAAKLRDGAVYGYFLPRPDLHLLWGQELVERRPSDWFGKAIGEELLSAGQTDDGPLFIEVNGLQSALSSSDASLTTGFDDELQTLSSYLQFLVRWSLTHPLEARTGKFESVWRTLQESWNRANPADLIGDSVAQHWARVVREHSLKAKKAGTLGAQRRNRKNQVTPR